MKQIIKLFSRAGAITLVSLLLPQVALQTMEAAKAVAPFKPAIVFVNGTSSGNSLCLTDSSGSKSKVLLKTTQAQEYFHNPVWTADGKQIVFKRVLLDQATFPYTVIDSSIWIINSDGGGLRNLGPLPQLEGYDPRLIGWLPGTAKLVLNTILNDCFYTFDPLAPSAPPARHQIPLEIATRSEFPQRPQLTFSSDTNPLEPGFQGYMILPAVPTKTEIWQGQEYLVYAEDFNDLWRVPANQDLEGAFTFGIPVRITDTPVTHDIDPAISPDQNWVSFSPWGSALEGLSLFSVCSLNGGEVLTLAACQPQSSGTWSPDSRHVAFQVRGMDRSEIVRVSIAAPGTLVYLASGPRFTTMRDANWNPKWVNDIDR